MIDGNVRGDISIPSGVMSPCLMVASSQKRKVSVQIKIKSVLRLTNQFHWWGLHLILIYFDIDPEAMFPVR